MDQRFTHVAVSVERGLFEPRSRGDFLAVYSEVFGWSEKSSLSIPNERIFLRAPSDSQYITIRAADAPMQTSGYEHLGVWLGSEADVRATHERAAKLTPRFPDLELGPIQSLYEDTLLTFRLRFRLPLTIEVQHFPLRFEQP